MKILRFALVFRPFLFNFLDCGLVFKSYEHSRKVTVRYGNTQALCCNSRLVALYNLVALNMPPDFQRFLLGLLLLAADVRNEVIDHFGPSFKSLARTRNCLICACKYFGNTEFSQRRKSGNIALNGAVRLNGNKSALCSETLFLRVDNRRVIRVYLGDNHRNIGCETVRGVIRHNGAFRFCVSLLESLYFVLLHINRAEYEINL